MSLDLSLVVANAPCTCECGHQHTSTTPREVYSSNITHNLNKMFEAAGVYRILWHGEGLVAGEVVEKLEAAHKDMVANPKTYMVHDAPNGWGTYPDAVQWLEEVIQACKEHPAATLVCSR